MLSYQIREYYEFALNELEKLEESIKVLFEYEEKYRATTSNTLTQILAISSKGSSSGYYTYSVKDGSLIDSFNAVNVELSSKFDLLGAFGAFSLYKQNFIKYKSDNNIPDSDADMFVEQIDSLFKSYQIYIQSQNDRAKAVTFVQILFSFKGYFNAMKNLYLSIVSMFDSQIVESVVPQNCSIMEIQLLKVQLNFSEFTSHLHSIQKIYTELCQVIGAEETIAPLEIIKIESGSLLSKILGDDNIIEALGLLLKKTITLCFEKFTKGGQLLTHSEVRKHLQEDVNLRDELKSRGFDVSLADEQISKTFVLVTKETHRLALATPSFKINGELIECRDYENKKYLEASRIKRLEE